jgi:acyl carrier protein
MTPEEIRVKVATIIGEKVTSKIRAEQVQWNTRLREDLESDSLAVVELMYEIEETFGTALPETDPRTLVTVRDLVDAIARELELKSAGAVRLTHG